MCKKLPDNTCGKETYVVDVCYSMVAHTEACLKSSGKNGVYQYIDGHYWLTKVEKI